MAAVDTQPPPPTPAPRHAAPRGFFTFLKDGVAAAARNRGLFLPLAALHAGHSMAFFFVANKLLPRYFATAVDLDAHANLDGGNLPLALLSKFLSGRWHLLVPAAVACLAAHEALGMAIDVATATAAVAACSSSGVGDGDGDGEPRRRRRHATTTTTTTTLASLLGKVRRNLFGPMDTALHGEMVGWVIDGGVAAVLVAAPRAAYLGCLVQLAASLFTFFYFGVVRAVAVVVSVAEPGRCGEGAVGRARRLMRGRRRLAQAALCAPAAWVWKVHAVTVAPDSILTAPFRLDGIVVYLLLGALKVVCAAIVTAYYFDCRRPEEEEEEEKAGHRE